MKGSEAGAIVLIVKLDAPVLWVWNALADEHVLRRWRTGNPRLELRQGGAFEETWTDDTGAEHRAGGTVREVLPGRRLHLAWAEQGWARPTEAILELTDTGGSTQLAVRHAGWEQLDEGSQLAESYRRHWTKFTEQLVQYLANSENP